MILIGIGAGGCSVSRIDSAFAQFEDREATGSLRGALASGPTESDLAFARNAASDVLAKGDKDSSQHWENPETGARGSVTPLAESYSSVHGRNCRDFLASFVSDSTESWLQGTACQHGHGRWEIKALKPPAQG